MSKLTRISAAASLLSLVALVPATAYDVGEDKDLDDCRTVSVDPARHEEWRKKQIAACSTLLRRTDKLATDSRYEAYLHRGTAHGEDNGELDAAISDFSEAIKLNPDNGPYMQRGEAYQGKRDFAAAAIDYDTVAKSAPNTAYLIYLRGTLSDDTGNVDEAIRLFSDAIKLNPKLFNAYLRRGMAMRRKGDVDRAIANYSEAIRISPTDWRPFYNRGNAYSQKGDEDRAIQDFSESIKLYPDSALSYLNRGIGYAKKKQFDRAIADFNTAMKLEPNNPHIYYNRGDALAKTGKLEASIGDFSTSLKIDPQYYDSNRLRGYAQLQLGRVDDALADFDAAIRLDSQDGDAYIARARVRAKKGDIVGMKRDYDRAVAIFPTDTALAQERMTALAKTNATSTADILATVNGAQISKDDLAEALEGMEVSERNKSGAAENALNFLINRLLLTQEAAKSNISVDDLLTKRRGVAWSDSALSTFYERNKARYTADLVKASHILVPTQREAEEIMKIATPSNFAELAKTRSKGPSASQGGTLGWFNRNKMLADFAKVAFSAPVGSVAQTLVPSQFGWHVVLVEDRKLNYTSPLDDIKEQVANDFIADVDSTYLDELRRQAKITVAAAGKAR